jgi:hypothetical protein
VRTWNLTASSNELRQWLNYVTCLRGTEFNWSASHCSRRKCPPVLIRQEDVLTSEPLRTHNGGENEKSWLYKANNFTDWERCSIQNFSFVLGSSQVRMSSHNVFAWFVCRKGTHAYCMFAG